MTGGSLLYSEIRVTVTHTGGSVFFEEQKNKTFEMEFCKKAAPARVLSGFMRWTDVKDHRTTCQLQTNNPNNAAARGCIRVYSPSMTLLIHGAMTRPQGGRHSPVHNHNSSSTQLPATLWNQESLKRHRKGLKCAIWIWSPLKSEETSSLEGIQHDRTEVWWIFHSLEVKHQTRVSKCHLATGFWIWTRLKYCETNPQ